MKDYKIKLRKCAYIFDNSANNFKWSKQQAETDHKKQNILKEFYNSEEKRSEWIPATKKTIKFYNGETVEQIQINLNGQEFFLNALQIAETTEPKEIYNNKKIIDFNFFHSVNFKSFSNSNTFLYSKAFKSLYFENFTGADDLGYIRTHFKRNLIKFVIDNKSNLYTAEGIEHKPTTRAHILECLEITSAEALREFGEVMDFIQGRSNQAEGGKKND